MAKKEAGQSDPKDNTDNMEAVRELLFGKRTAEINSRIEENEQNLRDALIRMEERVESKLNVLETLLSEKMSAVESHIDSVDGRLKKEAKTRSKEVEETRRSLQEKESSLNDRVHSLEDQLHQVEKKIWDELHRRFNQQSEQIAQLRKELLERLNNDVTAVADKSADRVELGDFLIDLGMRIQPSKDGSHRNNNAESAEENQPELAR